MRTTASLLTSSNGNIFRVTGPLWGNSPVPGQFPAQRPVMRSFHVFFELCLNKRLSKQSWGWWFETPSCPLWRHRNESPAPLCHAVTEWKTSWSIASHTCWPTWLRVLISDICGRFCAEIFYTQNALFGFISANISDWLITSSYSLAKNYNKIISKVAPHTNVTLVFHLKWVCGAVQWISV